MKKFKRYKLFISLAAVATILGATALSIFKNEKITPYAADEGTEEQEYVLTDEQIKAILDTPNHIPKTPNRAPSATDQNRLHFQRTYADTDFSPDIENFFYFYNDGTYNPYWEYPNFKFIYNAETQEITFDGVIDGENDITVYIPLYGLMKWLDIGDRLLITAHHISGTSRYGATRPPFILQLIVKNGDTNFTFSASQINIEAEGVEYNPSFYGTQLDGLRVTEGMRTENSYLCVFLLRGVVYSNFKFKISLTNEELGSATYVRPNSWVYPKGKKVIDTVLKGYDAAFGDGEKVGYRKGLADGQEYNMQNLIWKILDAPFTLLNNIFDFELFGINLAKAIKVVISLLIVGLVVKALL